MKSTDGRPASPMPLEAPRSIRLRAVAGLGLMAGLNLRHCRARTVESLRWLVAVSILVWLKAHWGWLPSPLARLAVVVEVFCLARAVAYGILAARWQGRTLQMEDGTSSVAILGVWTSWDELRTALWHALALVCLVPSIYLTFDRALPESLFAALSATSLTILLLLAGAHALALLRPVDP